MKYLIVEEIIDEQTMAIFKHCFEISNIVNIVSRDDFTNINLTNDETRQFRSSHIEIYFR